MIDMLRRQKRTRGRPHNTVRIRAMVEKRSLCRLARASLATTSHLKYLLRLKCSGEACPRQVFRPSSKGFPPNLNGIGRPQGPPPSSTPHPPLQVMLSVSLFLLLLVGCGGQQLAQQPDPRLALFHVLSSRIIMLDTQAEVDGTVQNTGKDRYPFDVTLGATFSNSSGKVIGQAQGTAEDVLPGMTRPFVLIGQVDSARYSRMVVTPVSLRERIHEKNLPSPPPVVP